MMFYKDCQVVQDYLYLFVFIYTLTMALNATNVKAFLGKENR